MRCRHSSRAGFSLVELVMVIGVLVILMAFALPMLSVGERARVDNAVSRIRETLQTARLRSVAVNRPLQVRFNCPDTGQYRIVEAGFGEDGRCDPTTYPYPADGDAAYQNKPRFDGPLQSVDPRVTLAYGDTSLVLQFRPDGRMEKVVGGVPQLTSTVPIAVSSNGYQRTIDVNNLGKVFANRY